MQKWLSGDSEMVGKMMAEQLEFFNSCDANGDGVLNLEEWRAYGQKNVEKAANEGTFYDSRPETWEKMYGIFNDANSATDGVSYADWTACMGVFSKVHEEMKSQMGIE